MISISVTQTFLLLNNCQALVIKADGEIISSYEFTLGLAGNRIKIKENTGRIVDYEYDKTYKLLKETITYQGQTASEISYAYDNVGNRLSMTSNGTTVNYTYDKNNRLILEDSNTYTYDNNGNIILKAGTGETVSYFYDYNNGLKSAVTTNEAGTLTVEYNYDIDGIRVEKIVDGINVSRYTVDKNRIYAQVLEERDSDGKLVVSYVYGDDLISQKRGDVTNYYHFDGLGSTRALTDAEGKITDTYTYGAFGTLIEVTGNTLNEYLFTGQQYDNNVGFYYLRARYMNPSIGRFQTMDTYEGNVFDPSSLHKYTYCNNDPVNFVDYLGLYSSAVIGTRIHQHIRDFLYPNQNILFGKIPSWPEILFPDIADLDTKEVYEIKPFSRYGVTTGYVQLAGYITALNIVGVANPNIGARWKPGTTWAPPIGPHTEPVTQTAYIIVGNFGGVVFYWFPQRKLDKKVWKKIEQAVSESDRVSEDVSEAYALQSQLTAIELQAITQNLVKVALGASVAYLTAYMAYATFRMSLLAVCPI
jgi:RHS repeat-associated protein